MRVIVEPEDHQMIVSDKTLFRLVGRILFEAGGLVGVIVEGRLVSDHEVPAG